MTADNKAENFQQKNRELLRELDRTRRERSDAERLVRIAFEDARRGVTVRGGLTAEGEKWLKDAMKVLKRVESRRKGA